jgi:predicted deacylase
MGCNDDVDPERAADQAMALLRMLAGRGFVDGPSGNPALSCEATALTAMAQVRSPVTGLVAYRRRLGDRVRKGDLVATVIDPLGEETELRAEPTGGSLPATASLMPGRGACSARSPARFRWKAGRAICSRIDAARSCHRRS